ncbi:MAG TPA: hypothetical protein VN612_11020, partial [Acidobacteriaceae bacterium]|nr:hypothetical protein [Acidobacteriaceae bacterium]
MGANGAQRLAAIVEGDDACAAYPIEYLVQPVNLSAERTGQIRWLLLRPSKAVQRRSFDWLIEPRFDERAHEPELAWRETRAAIWAAEHLTAGIEAHHRSGSPPADHLHGLVRGEALASEQTEIRQRTDRNTQRVGADP